MLRRRSPESGGRSESSSSPGNSVRAGGHGLVLVLAWGGLFLVAAPAGVAADQKKISFDMGVSGGAAACLPDASAHVKVEKKKGAEKMDIHVTGLAPYAVFNVFVIQK